MWLINGLGLVTFGISASFVFLLLIFMRLACCVDGGARWRQCGCPGKRQSTFKEKHICPIFIFVLNDIIFPIDYYGCQSLTAVIADCVLIKQGWFLCHSTQRSAVTLTDFHSEAATCTSRTQGTYLQCQPDKVVETTFWLHVSGEKISYTQIFQSHVILCM